MAKLASIDRWPLPRCKPYLRKADQPGGEGEGAGGGYDVDLSPGVLADLHRDAAKRWSEREYLEQAMGHKYS